MKKLLLIILLSICFQELVPDAKAASTYIVTNEEGQETIDTITAQFTDQLDLDKGKRAIAYKKYLKAWNPHVANWKHLVRGTKIFVESPSLPLSSGELAPNYYSYPHYVSESIFEKPKLSFLFTASMGNFQEKLRTAEGGNIASNQNSPYSLGLAGAADFTNSENYLSASAYWSKLTATISTGDVPYPSELVVPSEFGFNTYFNHPFVYNDINFSYYGGIDFESFPTFNTIHFVNREDLGFNQNRIIYATIGGEQVGYWKNHQVNFKLSFAKSLLSGTSSVDTSDRFSGYRVLFFTNYKISDRINCHFLYKLHVFSGPTDLTVNRFGIGLSMPIF